MTEILVISEYFAPFNSIASIRFTKVLKYLSRKNKYHFTVIARKSQDEYDSMLQKELQEMNASVTVYYIDIMNNPIDYLRNRKKSNVNKVEISSTTNVIKFKPYRDATLKERLYKIANTLKYVYNEELFAIRGLKLLEKLNLRYQCVLSSFGDAGAHLLALKYIANHADTNWIADYRDPIMTYYRPPIFNPFFKSILDNSITKAKVITGVNEVAMGEAIASPKSKVIINGYDKEDLKNLFTSKVNLAENKLHICYTGRIYGGKSNAKILFKALQELSLSKQINLEDIRIDYAGSNFDLLEKQAKEYCLKNLLVNHGYVERNDALSIQKQSQLLLVLSWNDDDEADVLTGKFMEYLMMERNILALVTGNKTNCTIYKILAKSNAGYCYEEARGITEYEVLKKYLLSIYQEFVCNGRVTYKGNSDFLNKFDYYYIAKQFEELFT